MVLWVGRELQHQQGMKVFKVTYFSYEWDEVQDLELEGRNAEEVLCAVYGFLLAASKAERCPPDVRQALSGVDAITVEVDHGQEN